MARRQVGAAPATDIEAATKGYVDGLIRPMLGRTPPGYWEPAEQVNAISNGAFAASGRLYLWPKLFLPGTYDAASITVSTAQVGGTATFSVGLYPLRSDGYCMPSTTGMLASTTIALTATGSPFGVLSSALTFTKPTVLWVAQLYYASVAPTTAPQVARISGTTTSLLPASGAGANTFIKAFYKGSQTALPTVETAYNGFTASAGTECANITFRAA